MIDDELEVTENEVLPETSSEGTDLSAPEDPVLDNSETITEDPSAGEDPAAPEESAGEDPAASEEIAGEDPAEAEPEELEEYEYEILMDSGDDHYFYNTDFADFTVTEGLLLLIFVIVLIDFFLNLVRRWF